MKRSAATNHDSLRGFGLQAQPAQRGNSQFRHGLAAVQYLTAPKAWLIFILVLLWPKPASLLAAQPAVFDVVVYGATPSGIIAAITVAVEGYSVVLLNPESHLGGMMSNGLGRTDVGAPGLVGGKAREFFRRLGAHYHTAIAWNFEPHVAEAVFESWLKETTVVVVPNCRLKKCTLRDQAITAISTNRGQYQARIYLDASYEGDLMAAAGVSYRVGREGAEVYNEALAGVRAASKEHQFTVPISPFTKKGKLLPLIDSGSPEVAGTGDAKVQAYTYRLCFSKDPRNQRPFRRPPHYRPSRYQLLKRYLASKPDLTLDALLLIFPLPNNKADVNNRGPISTDYLGGSWRYPEAGRRARNAIEREHRRYIQGYLYFLATDSSVPASIREQLNRWGLAADEFPDNDNWPRQLYIREARRMIGVHVLTQSEIQFGKQHEDTIGMGAYNMDSHHVQRFVRDGIVVNEGDFQVPVRPYQIPYRSMLPRKQECGNLLVSVCVSASHVAYASLRMEPHYMVMGQSAGTAASLAIETGKSLHDLDIRLVHQNLREQSQVLTLSERIASDAER